MLRNHLNSLLARTPHARFVQASRPPADPPPVTITYFEAGQAAALNPGAGNYVWVSVVLRSDLSWLTAQSWRFSFPSEVRVLGSDGRSSYYATSLPFSYSVWDADGTRYDGTETVTVQLDPF